MRHPVSTSDCSQVQHGAGVALGIVGLAVLPRPPDHTQTGGSKDPDGMGVGAATAVAGRFVASADQPPPWTTLRHFMPVSFNTRKVVQ